MSPIEAGVRCCHGCPLVHLYELEHASLPQSPREPQLLRRDGSNTLCGGLQAAPHCRRVSKPAWRRVEAPSLTLSCGLCGRLQRQRVAAGCPRLRPEQQHGGPLHPGSGDTVQQARPMVQAMVGAVHPASLRYPRAQAALAARLAPGPRQPHRPGTPSGTLCCSPLLLLETATLASCQEHTSYTPSLKGPSLKRCQITVLTLSLSHRVRPRGSCTWSPVSGVACPEPCTCGRYTLARECHTARTCLHIGMQSQPRRC